MNIQSNTQNGLGRVLEKICEIAEKSADGDYIFRGEAISYEKVCSSLYRQYAYDIELDDFEIEFVEKDILEAARKYTEKTNELDILIELHHHGGITNLIEFTTDSLIALFFACDGSPNENGRIILQKRDSVMSHLKQPHGPTKRVIAQKIVFIQPPKGFINPDEVITIPDDLKLPMLTYLRKAHGISTETIHNDLYGFIRNWDIHKSAYTQFHRGKTFRKRADSVQNWDEKLKWYERAVVHYTEALKLKPDFPEGYNNRGSVYYDAGDLDKAIQDHTKAIQIKPDYASAYNNRGIAYYSKGDVDSAIQDYCKAIELKSDYASAYNNIGIAYNKQGEFERAIQHYNKVIKLRPDFSEAYNNRGFAYLDKGDLDKAIKDLDTVIELDPTDAKAYSNLGAAYLRKGDFDRAIQNHNRAINLEPGFAGFYSNRGEAWLPLKQWEKAKADLTFAKSAGVDITASFYNDYESIKDFEEKNGFKLPEDIAAILMQQ